MKHSLKVILNLFFILILIGILFSYAMFQGGFVSWFLFSSFLPILIYHLLFIFYPIKDWKITRDFSQNTVRAGEDIVVSVQIERKLPFPIYYCVIEEEFSNTLNKLDVGRDKYLYMDHPNKLWKERKVKKVVFPWFMRRFQIDYSISQLPRGKHDWHGVHIKTGDMFGFVKKEHVFKLDDELIVYPNALSAHLNHAIGDYENGTVSTKNSFNQTNMAVGVREYEPGDRFSWIDWKQTAKKNMMMSKEFEREKSTNVTIVLNSCFHPNLYPLAYEASIELTLGIMETFQKRNTKVRLLTIGGINDYDFRVQEQENWKKLFHYLAVVQPKEDKSFSIHMKEKVRQISEGLIVVLTTQVDEELIKIVERSNQRICLLFIQPTSSLTKKERTWVERCRQAGIRIQLITEEQLVVNRMEVDLK